MTGKPSLTLASGSAIRASILRDHEIEFMVVKPDVDESVIKKEAAAAGLSLEETAMRLAEAKCLAVANSQPGFVVGSDQILEFEGKPFDKPADLDEAGARLLQMQGQTHSLINATVLASDGEIIWRNIARPRLTMREMDRAEIDDYLDAVGSQVLSSVGAYQVETKEGADLFSKISGDWFAVQGLAIYPLLDVLRREGAFGEAAKTPEPIRAGVVGHPISHSLSPLIHNEWARRAMIDGTYETVEVAPDYESFAKATDTLRAKGFAGVNVTLPHKENALRYANWTSAHAKHAEAANTLVFEGHKVRAYNTDVSGFSASLQKHHCEINENTNALVIGAGGAARGIVVALMALEAKKVTLTNRTKEKADAIASAFTGVSVVAWEDRNQAVSTADLIVNTTSLGMTGQPPLDIDLGELPQHAIVYDIVYTPLETQLLQAARKRGNKTINGLEMLMHQASPGFEAWFGGGWPYRANGIVDDDLRDLLIAELKRRGSI